MQDREPSIRNRELGNALRKAMRGKGYSGKYVAGQLDWAQSRVSRLLSGTRGIREEDVLAFLNLCEVTGVERDRLLHLVREVDIPVAAQPTGPLLPAVVRSYLEYERRATHIAQFAGLTLPDLLQTGDYAHAVLSASATVPHEYVPFRLSTVLGRAGLLSRKSPPTMDFLLHEWLLRTPVGGQTVLVDQLHHLLRSSARTTVSLRVVPISVGAQAGLAGDFCLLEFDEFSPVVYRAGEPNGRLTDSQRDVELHQDILADLAAIALCENESQELIAAIARELRR